ncbi:hypothetical protein LOK49_LG09G00369 [Camellia lanceoleosa]|uniref:Uncharacterized protein n=1 Tax=Camellia lanceoleosa TaxID=1840588 RepID=A0ACC0GLE9_9ERIC|nr:hypothetical protein LOK49_LG09G00369 [Camellia lanceoleosa]
MVYGTSPSPQERKQRKSSPVRKPRLREEDIADHGIILYMETIQDLLNLAIDNISIMEVPKT